jgi:hypothetical protein
MTFYSNGVWESHCPERMVGGGGVDSMLRFQLKRGEATGRSVAGR